MEAPILTKVPIEGDRLRDLEPFHDDEAERIAEGIALVGVPTNEPIGLNLVDNPHTLDRSEPLLHGIEETNGGTPALTGTVEQERVGFEDDGIRREEAPLALAQGGQQARRFGVARIVVDQVGIEAARVYEDRIHTLLVPVSVDLREMPVLVAGDVCVI